MDYVAKTDEPYNRTAVEMLLNELEQQKECNRAAKMIPCDERPLYSALMGYGFLVVFCLALVGNCLNLLIYSSECIRYYMAIRMLCTKLLMNTLTMLLLLPQALRIINVWELGDRMDMMYWSFWPYQTYLINVFGFCAMWLTVLMTAECYVHVFFPGRSKNVCTNRNVSKACLIIAVVGLVLALIYPLNRKVRLITKCHKLQINIATTASILMDFFEVLHTVGNLFIAIIIPLSLLVFMTAAIVWRLFLRRTLFDRDSGSRRFSAEKRCVTRITFITTSLHLISECPAVPVFIYAVLRGPHVVHTEPQLCLWHTSAQYLGICNASLSFFVYIIFSQRFRAMLIDRIRGSLYMQMPRSLRPQQHFKKTGDANDSETSRATIAANFKSDPSLKGPVKKSVDAYMTVVGASGFVSLVPPRREQLSINRTQKLEVPEKGPGSSDIFL
uniref:G-protein coupled receptors family 1 profile domain-containing protein n=3 Tax=Parascaris univalens TaxID=6257 RepID=A0A915BA02_PARUN